MQDEGVDVLKVLDQRILKMVQIFIGVPKIGPEEYMKFGKAYMWTDFWGIM